MDPQRRLIFNNPCEPIQQIVQGLSIVNRAPLVKLRRWRR